MDKDGHFGFSLLIYFSFVYLLNLVSRYVLIIGLLAAALSSLPDIDVRLRIKHRGVTHSILTGLILGIPFGYLTYNILDDFYMGFLSVSLAFLFHILGDLLTIRSFYPIYPLADLNIALGLFRSDNRLVNKGFLASGSIMFIIYAYRLWGLDILSLIFR